MPRHSSDSTIKMAGQQMPEECRNLEMTNSASGSKSDKDTGSSSSSNGGGSSSGVESNNDQGSIRVSKSRPLARLDRLLRRWLPGYNYLRGSGTSGDIGGNQPPQTEAVAPSLSAMKEQRSGRQAPFTVDLPMPARKRRDGEVLLDAGIAKSEFCLKLERLLRAKLIIKD